MASTSFALLSPKPNLFIRRESSNSVVKPIKTSQLVNTSHGGSHLCSATSLPSSSSLITEFDLYDLLGIESSSDQTAIKTAYRFLQKRCHPDIAGPEAHDMAIILNEAYAVLSDPLSRSAYDKEQAKTAELQGFTGRPLYSVWSGSETEERAVFVDEVRCVGCLKCALFADKTFAIESAYGRARVVAQWADPEHKIQQSIDVCPVNCISMVQRADLAALEFLMSKQPRGNVKIGASNTGGKRVFDVFSELKVFHKRLDEAIQRKSHLDSKYSTMQRDARVSAIQTIRSISNWFYWKPPGSESTSDAIVKADKRGSDAEIKKLRDAVEARRNAMFRNVESSKLLPQTTSVEYYWLPPVSVKTKTKSSARPTISYPPTSESKQDAASKTTHVKKETIKHRSPFVTGIPMGLSLIAASVVRFHETGNTIGGLQEHIGGSVALEVVNSSSLQVMLAGATWYAVGVVVICLVEGLARRG